ncbi:MAG: D-alanyl-D-alanine carboxypeptidase [Clostridia bacterium]|nr:D-alanyl-D-alanine carboxypeptidase [Clostridia bacterium]
MFKGIKKFIIAAASFAFILSVATVFSQGKITASADGVAEVAMELTSGKILHEKNIDCRLPMASTTKIMTAIIIVEECKLDEVITVPEQSVGVEGSSIYLKHGEQISVKDLLYGLMMRSGNDAACALAIHHSGSVEAFVEHMNSRAEEMGATNSHFKNPSGLPDNEHYTTARDLCNIARYAMSNDTFSEIVGSKSYSGDFRQYVNKNRLLSMLDGANGVKTGYTEKAGRCLVSSAKRGNMDVVCVVLNCYDMFERSKKLINNCFDRYSAEIISADRVFEYDGKACTLGEDCTVVTENGAELRYEIVKTERPENRKAVAELQIYCKNNLIFSHNLYTIN